MSPHKWLTSCALVATVGLALPESANAVDLRRHQALSTRFVTTLQIPARGRGQVKDVVYGNAEYGYYSVAPIAREGDKLKIEVMPPGYRYPVDFYVGYAAPKGRTLYRKVGRKQFKSPVPTIYRSMEGKVEHGRFTSNYFLVNGALPKQKLLDPNFKAKDDEIFEKDKYRFTFMMVLNRLGEIVWIHVPAYRDTVFTSYMASRQYAPGRYAFIFGKKAGYGATVDYKGQVLAQLSSRHAASPFTMHHDFLMTEDGHFLTFSNQAKPVPGRKGETFLSDLIIKADPATGAFKMVADLLRFFDPNRDPYWSGDAEDDEKFVLWGQPKADFEFLHVNGIEFFPGEGYLVSIRNLNKVVMFDESFRKIRWTLGINPKDTFRVTAEADRFLHQHTPALLDNGDVLLFDNGRDKGRSRLVTYRRDARTHSARAVWTWEPNPPMYARNRSSVAVLPSGDVVAYFVSPSIGANTRPQKPNVDYLMEVDYETRKERARMSRIFETLSPGYRAVPIDTIGAETYLGPRFDPRDAGDNS